MLHFIHTYTDKTYEALRLQNLWHDGDGLKLMHKAYYTPDKQFNFRGKIGGKLYNVLKEERCPFYIDRFQGGNPLPYHYEYDSVLLEEYSKLLGNNFWGFQMHEWASNYRSEAIRIQDQINNYIAKTPDSDIATFWKTMTEEVKRDPLAVSCEAFSADEWAGMRMPETVGDFVMGAHMLWNGRMQKLGVPLFPADSYFMSHKLVIANGTKRLLPEVGWQIPHQRVQIAYTRGMARSAGIPFGIYSECWSSQNMPGLSIPYTADSTFNEWDEDELLGELKERCCGKQANGGFSRSLQERSWTNAYFQGATIIGEEYGVCNTFTNYQDFTLSEYGKIKKSFLDFAASNKNIGNSYTPFAIVLPAEMEFLTLGEWNDGVMNGYLYYPFDSMSVPFADKVRKANYAVYSLLSDYNCGIERLGNEAHVLQNGNYPDVFDIIHGDMTGALDKYPYIIDATGDASFAKRHKHKIVNIEDVSILLQNVLPVTVSGKLHYTINRTDNGWLVLVMNNNGVNCVHCNGEEKLSEATLVGELLPGFLSNPHCEKVAGNGVIQIENEHIILKLQAGEWMIIKLS